MKVFIVQIVLVFLCQFPGEANAQGPVSEPPPEFISTRDISQVSLNEFVVNVNVSHNGYEGYAKFTDLIPQGFEATELISSNGIFSFRNRTVKIVWMQLPAKQEIVIRYKMKAVRVPSGEYTIRGDVAYAKEDFNLAARDIPLTNFSFDNVMAKNEAQNDAALAREAAYKEAMRDGDLNFDRNNFGGAIAKFEKALQIKPENKVQIEKKIAEAKAKLDILNALLERDASKMSERDRSAMLEEKFKALMKEGDRLASIEKDGAAIARYEDALIIKPNDAVVLSKIKGLKEKASNTRLSSAERKINDAKYKEYMTNGDAKLVSRKFDDAIASFSEASLLKPNEASPKEKIAYARKKKAELSAKSIAEKDKATRANEYKILLSEANLFFDRADFNNSLKLYEHALRINPEGTEARIRIEEIKNMKSAEITPSEVEEVDTEGKTWDENWERAPRSEAELLMLIAESASDEDAEYTRKRNHQNKVVTDDEVEVAEKISEGKMTTGLTNSVDLKGAEVSYTSERHLTEKEKARLAESNWEVKHKNELLTKKQDLEVNKGEIDESEDGLVYRIQLASSATQLESGHFQKQYGFEQPVIIKRVDGRYKYLAGVFKNFKEANVFKAYLLEKGAEGIFMVITYNGERITLDDAQLLEAKGE